MKFVVDQIIDKVVSLENLETGEMIFVSIDDIKCPINDGVILNYVDGVYSLDDVVNNERRKKIEEKFNRLKGL